MKKVVVVVCLTIFSFITLYAEDNKTAKKVENNATVQAEKQLQEQIEREKKFAKEQTFYKGQDYDLSYAEVDSSSLDNIHVAEPDYDFNMDDVYD
jgi:hypothetical protein